MRTYRELLKELSVAGRMTGMVCEMPLMDERGGAHNPKDIWVRINFLTAMPEVWETYDRVTALLTQVPGPYRYYPNPQVSGHGWVGQDRCTEDKNYCRENGVGGVTHKPNWREAVDAGRYEPYYQPTPHGAVCIPMHVKKELGVRLVNDLNVWWGQQMGRLFLELRKDAMDRAEHRV